jgi:hypothetical protein
LFFLVLFFIPDAIYYFYFLTSCFLLSGFFFGSSFFGASFFGTTSCNLVTAFFFGDFLASFLGEGLACFFLFLGEESVFFFLSSSPYT